MSFIDAHLWHHGPPTLDWVLDLEKGTFGPLHVHSNIHDIKQHLGRPDDSKVFGKPHRCRYDRFNLHIELEPDLTLWELELETEIELPPEQRQAFDPKVKLPGGALKPLRALSLDDFKAALGDPTRLDGNKFAEHVLEYDFEAHSISIDVDGEQRVTAVGFSTLGG